MTGISLLRSCALVLPAICLVPNVALADRGGRYDRGERYEHHRHDDADHWRIDINFGRGAGAPVYEERTTRVWVEPTYRTVYDRVWVEPVVREECDRVWVPDRYEYRDVVFWDCGRRVVRRDRVLIAPGHYEDVRRQVIVSPGHWETVARQEVVCPGHWEYQTERVAVADYDRVDRFDIHASIGRR